MSTELERCTTRAADADQALRHALLTLLHSSGMDTPTKRTDRFMETLEQYVEARMDLREAEHEARRVESLYY